LKPEGVHKDDASAVISCYDVMKTRNYGLTIFPDLIKDCGVVCIGMREDTHVNILPSPKGLVLEMEHERSGWTS
jgi:hypothetical protein